LTTAGHSHHQREIHDISGVGEDERRTEPESDEDERAHQVEQTDAERADREDADEGLGDVGTVLGVGESPSLVDPRRKPDFHSSGGNRRMRGQARDHPRRP
jgi:hypothetical protein